MWSLYGVFNVNIYIASRFILISEIKVISDTLEAMGHKITVKWWEIEDKKNIKAADRKPYSDEDWYDLPEVKKVYKRDLQGIDDCDVVLIITGKYSMLKGAIFEAGYAVARGKPVYCYGQLKRSAMFSQIQQFKNFRWFIRNVLKG